MTKRNDGGPAFPTEAPFDEGPIGKTFTIPGMTLRQWYAGQALMGLFALPDERFYSGDKEKETIDQWRDRLRKNDVELCFAYADAMIAEGEK